MEAIQDGNLWSDNPLEQAVPAFADMLGEYYELFYRPIEI